MLQSEFFERTHITLTGEEYADVECLYNAVKMDKDEFCKRWVSEKKNPLFKELAEAFCHEYRMHLSDINQMQANGKSYNEEIEHLKGQLAEKDRVHEDILSETLKKKNAEFMSFVRNLITANEDSARKVYDVIEEECGLDFIIRTKHEAGIPLSESEIDYMVGKL